MSQDIRTNSNLIILDNKERTGDCMDKYILKNTITYPDGSVVNTFAPEELTAEERESRQNRLKAAVENFARNMRKEVKV